jgi:lipoprotein-anchoring transpeptidase ErfK/SrfK
VRNLPLYLTVTIVASFLVMIVGMVLFLPRKAELCANSVSCINNLSGEKEASNQGTFMGRKVNAPELPDKQVMLKKNLATDVLGVQSNDYKRIYVDLTNQRLYAFEGNNIIMNVPVSTGKWNRTPTGTFRIWIWLKYTRMTGGSGADYYNLPNVPYTMYFYNDSISKASGYSLHGTYWHNNFGHPMSHGCVNMKIEDAQKLFYWTNPGTLITVYGTTPNN